MPHSGKRRLCGWQRGCRRHARRGRAFFQWRAGRDPRPRAVERHMQPFRQAHALAYLPFDGCRLCGSPCRYRQAVEPVTLDKALHAGFQEALLTFDRRPDSAYNEQNWLEVAHVCAVAAACPEPVEGAQAGHGGQVDAAYCYFAHEKG